MAINETEVAGIRPFNPQNPLDADRLHTTFQLLPSEFSNMWSRTREDIDVEIEITRPEDTVPNKLTYYAVVSNSPDLPLEEKDQVQGWISVEPDLNAKKLTELGILPRHREALEIVYARFPDSPVRRHVASGVRQVCARMGETYAQNGSLADLLITAYVLNRNAASQGLLRASGFRDHGDSNLWLADQVPFRVYALDWQSLNQPKVRS